MNRFGLIVATTAFIVGTAFASSAIARDRGDRADRNGPTASQIVAQEDARTARIKADLRLTPDQEKNWPGLETALHEIGAARADRIIAFRADREQRKAPGDVIEQLNNRAKFLGERSADLKKLADAAQPLFTSLDEQQKRRFANELMRLSGGRDAEQ